MITRNLSLFETYILLWMSVLLWYIFLENRWKSLNFEYNLSNKQFIFYLLIASFYEIKVNMKINSDLLNLPNKPFYTFRAQTSFPTTKVCTSWQVQVLLVLSNAWQSGQNNPTVTSISSMVGSMSTPLTPFVILNFMDSTNLVTGVGGLERSFIMSHLFAYLCTLTNFVLVCQVAPKEVSLFLKTL